MKFKTYTGITWSLLELTGLLEDEESRVYFEKSKKHFGLHPFHLTNLNASLNEILSSNLNSYDSELKGFLLAYQNPKLLTPLGEIFYDTCFIHVDVEAEFYVFRPEVGTSIKGIVNKKGVDHIGVLVHKAFNVSIPKPDDEENWLGDNLEIGQEVRFAITFLDLNSKLPFIRGNLDPDNYLQGCRLMKKTRRQKKQETNVENVHNDEGKGQHTFFDSENSSDENAVQIKEENPTPSRKKRLSKQEDIIKHTENNEDSSDENAVQIKEETPKPSRKKRLSKQQDIIEHTENNEDSSDENAVQIKEETPKPSRKKRLSKQEDLIEHTENNEDSSDENAVEIKKETPKPSRKKRLSEQSDVIEYDENNEDKRHIKKIKESRSRKKSRSYSSQSSTDEHADVKFNNSPTKLSRRLSSVEPEDRFRMIKSEISSNIVINEIKEEIMSENESEPKKSFTKRKYFDEIDSSTSDLITEKDVQSPSKKSSKKQKALNKSINGSLTDIKLEESFNNSLVNEIDNKVEESPSKKKYKRLKNVKEEDCAEISCNINEETEPSVDKKKRKRQSRKSLLDLSEIKMEPAFEDVEIKIEEPDDINTDNELIKKRRDRDAHVDKTKKRNFEDDDLQGYKVKIKKERYASSSGSDVEEQKVKVHKVKVKVKKEKSVVNVASDEDEQVMNSDKVKIKKEKYIANSVTDEVQIDTYDQCDKQIKKHKKGSPTKQFNVSEGDVKKDKVKMEKSIDD